MNTSKPTRRHLIENCITKGLLVAGASSMSQTQLLAFWEQGEAQANKPTSPEVLGPFFRKGAPNNTTLRVSGEPGFPLRVDGKVTCDCEITFRVVDFPAPDLRAYMQKEAERLQFPLKAIADG